jgi:NitT/TauT family transport system substrate-binding protein
MRYVIAVASICSLFALHQPAASAQERTIRFHEYPGNILNLVTWVMVEKGFCSQEKLKCEPVLIPAAPTAAQAAIAGSLDLIYWSADGMMQAIAKGNDLITVQPQIANNVYSLLAVPGIVPQSTNYPDAMRYLKGKTIGVSARGSATELQAKALFVGAGMPPDSATYIAVGAPNTAFAALVSKQVDAALSWDPIVALCDSSQKCSVIADMRKGQGPGDVKAMNGSFVTWCARRDYVSKNEETVDAFRRASDKATAWLKDPKNRAETMEIASKHLKLGNIENPDAVMKQVVEETIANYSTTFVRSSFEGMSQFLVKSDMIQKPLKVEDIVYRKVLQSAK